MSEHTDADALKAHYKKMVTRGIAAALLLAALSLAEYYVAIEIDDPTSTALRGMAGVGLAVAGISLAVQFWARARRRNK